MIDWRQLLIEIRRNYKPLTLVAREIGMNAKHLQRITQKGTVRMQYENGVKIIDLHNKYVRKLNHD